ncbi:MAG TPA: hypothetical protein VG649_11100 [Candidatus Angelobacter sp.]|jgi:hypothetical protein|nr:hypothetical protein [Candidatus Angelobacter sp.]
MTDHHKKHFFEHWITAYGNRLDEVARHKKTTTAKLSEGSVQEGPLSASPAIDLPPRQHTIHAETAVKTPINRSHQ